MNADKIEDVMSELLGEGYRIVEDNGELSPVIDWVTGSKTRRTRSRSRSLSRTAPPGPSTRAFPCARSGTRTSTERLHH